MLGEGASVIRAPGPRAVPCLPPALWLRPICRGTVRRPHPREHRLGGLVARVLRHELTTKGLGEDCLVEPAHAPPPLVDSGQADPRESCTDPLHDQRHLLERCKWNPEL